MNVAQFVETLESKHVELSVTTKGKLRIVSNQKFINSSAFDQLRNHKTQVVSHLSLQQAERLVWSLTLHDDRVFVRQQLIGVYDSDRLAIVQEYFNQWQQAASSEPTPHKKDNAGRYQANVWLLELTTKE